MSETSSEISSDTQPSEALAAALELVAEGKAPPLTLIHEGSEATTAEGLSDPGDAAAWIRAELERGALDADAPDRTVTWVPGSPEALGAYVPLFVLLRELGYAQSFEFGPFSEGLEDYAELMVPLVDMGAQFSNDQKAAFLAPSSEAPATVTAALDAEDEAAPADHGGDDGTRSLLLILVGSLLLIGSLGGGFTYLAHLQEKGKLQESETKAREAQNAYDEGVKARKRRNYAQAEQLFRRCLELQPTRVEAAAELGAVLSEDMNRHEDALKVYARTLKSVGGKQNAATALHFNQGNALLRLKRYEEAVDAYDLALEVVPVQARLNKITALIELGRTAEAKQALEPFLITRKPTFGGKVMSPALRGKVFQLKKRLGIR